MKIKWNHKIVSIVLAVLLLFSVSSQVMGANGLTEIQAYLNNGIKVVLHGELFEPTDPSDGSKYVPITYKGRTYLPLRAVAEAVGLEVGWDAPNNTATLGDSAGDIAKDQLSFIRVSPEYARSGSDMYKLKSRTPDYLNRAPGKTFEFGYASDPGFYAGMQITVMTNYEYDKFKATFWVDEEKDEEGNYLGSDPEIIFLDEHGIEVKKMNVEHGKLYEVELDIKDVQELDVWVTGSLSIIGEPMIGK